VIRDFFSGILFAISYFTIVPLKAKFIDSKAFFRGILTSLPIIGAILYLIIYLAFNSLSNTFPIDYLVIAVPILYFISYGFLHLEAICDITDGYFASLSNKNIYKILKEPYVGSIGVIATILFLILKISLISQILIDNISYLFLALILSRVSTIYPLYFFDFHKNSYLAKSLKSSLGSFWTIFIIFLTLIPLSLLFNFLDILSIFVISISFSIFLSFYIKEKLGFLNGDFLGFNIELNELLILHLFYILSIN
jgi:adenosylcobinamide-GDP ribazoletransferase